MMELRLPRSLTGWKHLALITARRCVHCHGPLLHDWPQYDDGTLWCMKCGGLPHPGGFWDALYWNFVAHRQHTALKNCHADDEKTKDWNEFNSTQG